ncbi:hypothetical protein [Kitasatospora sp. KL5]|uniref:hypothetical protein n=1 Tax=Kitasatospora sp. KL5 TaxID=3425125 RepID=UPI003D6F2BB5
MSEQTNSGGQQHSAPQPRVASTSELIGASHQLAQATQAHLGTSTPSPAPANGQQR